MKSFISVLIVLICMIIQLQFCLECTHISRKYSFEVPDRGKFASDQPTLQHGVVKRPISAPTTGDKAICDAELSNVTCTLSTGVQQGLVEAALSCNNTYYMKISRKPKDMQIFAQKVKMDSSVDHYGIITESNQCL